MPGQIAIGDDKFTLAGDNQLPSGRRAITRRTRSTQPGDPHQIQTYRWALSGPLGLSREREDGFLGVDYASLDHRYPQRLTSLPRRTVVSLTAPAASAQFGLPASTVSTTNWAEGAGDGDGDAHDELGNGIEGGTPNDATFWGTTTTDAEIILGVQSLNDPGVDTGHEINVRIRDDGGGSPLFSVRLYQGATLISTFETIVSPSASFVTFGFTLPESEIANITDYTTLRVAVFAQPTGTMDVSEIELQLPDTEAARVIAIDEDRGQLFVTRGTHETQVNPSDMAEVENNDRSAVIVDTAFAGGEGLVSFGTAQAVQRRATVTPAGATYAAVSGNPKAHQIRFGADRLWFVDADADDGALKFSFDGLVAISNVNRAGDQSVAPTGLGVYGPYVMVGRRNGYFGFTEAGQSVRTIEGMEDFPSALNGAASDSAFGWHYVAHRLGLGALVPGAIDNDVGPMNILTFEGPIDGVITAVKRWKNALWIALLTDPEDVASGTLWILRGVFNPQITPATGQLDWYTVDELVGAECYALGATAGRTTAQATLVRGSGEDIAFYDLAFRDREIERSGYLYNTDGGEWFGSTLVRGPNRRKAIRQYHVRVKDVTSINTWTLAVQFDGSGSYSNVGSVINSGSDGIRTVKAVSGGVPQNLSGFEIKPRFTQSATNAASPPTLEGFLDIEVDERPDNVEEVDATVILQGRDYALLNRYAIEASGEETLYRDPVKITFDDIDTFGFVMAVDDVQDVAGGDGAQRATAHIILWDTA